MKKEDKQAAGVVETERKLELPVIIAGKMIKNAEVPVGSLRKTLLRRCSGFTADHNLFVVVPFNLQ